MWMNLYNSIGETSVDYELVFVGPNAPEYELPKNFRFIQSNVKPAQCSEIAYRAASGNLVMPIADDCRFMTKNPLDKLLEIYKANNNDKLIVSCRYMLMEVDHSHYAHRFFIKDEHTPYIMPLCGLMSKKFYMELGGVDRGFIAAYYDLDITMRAYYAGGDVKMSYVYVNEDKPEGTPTFHHEIWTNDRNLLERLWSSHRIINLNRTIPLEPISDEDILTKSQGKRYGLWD
jgi:hypothetical protein